MSKKLLIIGGIVMAVVLVGLVIAILATGGFSSPF